MQEERVNLCITDLLSNAHSKSDFECERFFFKGDLQQMACAKILSDSLGIRVLIEEGFPFVTSADDFKLITRELWLRQINGWWHYKKDNDICEFDGKYYFNGSYMQKREQIYEVAKKLGINIRLTLSFIQFVDSKSDYMSIVKKLGSDV